ncbi:SDR family oxidoreductase [uncultured Clostridium sp.]|uniref:SDR family NAD(P)-dependent oxidoreductase n=1 Tax=uncultured Clostridium sp. TaxID=59620 RepID=UPI0028EB92CD|nr:SDR family oxidoreductase [uncultured Clostridium sp.]
MIKLSNKTIIVTGAGSGIGKSITVKCLECGAKVIACDINGHLLKALETGVHSDKLQTCIVDVSDYSQVETLLKKLFSEQPDINCLVNNAGIYLGKDIAEYTLDMIDKVININIKGAVFFSKFFGEFKLDQKENGVIVNISSVAGLEGSSDAIYGLSKSALIGLTKSCAMNFSPFVRVNAVAPTLVDTDLISNVPKWRIDEYREKELIKRSLKSDDVANTTTFLLSELSNNYTGAIFDINNGCYLR